MRLSPEPLLLGAVVVLAALGLLVEALYGLNAFSRSGALITAFGIAMAGRAIWRAEMAIARNESRVEKLEASYLDKAREGRIDEDAFSQLAELLSTYRTSRLKRMGRMVFAEIAAVCTGTLIWGFGDLFANLTLHCGELEC